jgi:putative ABC transport system ATP-binding protein
MRVCGASAADRRGPLRPHGVEVRRASNAAATTPSDATLGGCHICRMLSRASEPGQMALVWCSVLRLDKVNKYYRVGTHSLHVLRDIELEVADGEFVAIMGASGSGKSTLLNILGILDDYDSGEYWLGDTVIRNLSERKSANYRNRFIGFVFQSFNLLPFKTALENVALPLYYQGVARRKRNQIAAQYLERVGLRDWAEHTPSEMSGGQKQRVAIARALIGKPRLILADEPTGALDSETSKQIMDLLSEIHRSGITVLVVTHDSEVAARTQRTIRLKDGKVMNPHELASASHPGMAAVT